MRAQPLIRNAGRLAGLLDLSVDVGYRSDNWEFLLGGISFNWAGRDQATLDRNIGVEFVRESHGPAGGWAGSP